MTRTHEVDLDAEFQACLSLYDKPRYRSDAEQLAVRCRNWCRENDAEILYPGHPNYPFDEREIECPPRFLSYWGSPVWNKKRTVSVVGSREPSFSARQWLNLHLSEFIRRTDAVVVSGGAHGIDQCAHWVSIRAGRPTVVFLPTGLGVPYPRDWQQWKTNVIEAGGSIVSTYPPEQMVRRHHFEERNRWIAAMGRMLFVAEARRRSGSAMTARLARDINRTTCCLPGPPDDPRCAGNVDMIFDGVQVIRDADDLEVLFNLCTFSG